MDSYELN